MEIQEDDDEGDINPMTIFLPDEPKVDIALTTVEENGLPNQPLDQQHYIHSVSSTVVIRQFPSQGLSFQLWPAATTLVTLLDLHRSNPTNSPFSSILPTTPLRILELGSGTGLVGIAAAVALGANVTVTDLPHVLPNLQFNADANADALALHGGTVHVAPLSWGETGDVGIIGRDFDLILASDVVYHDHLYEPLLQTLRFLLGGESEKKKKKMVFVMAHLRRWKKESAFFKKARKLFDIDTIHADGPSEGKRVGVVVYSFSGKSTKM